jgi:uncharacterized protein YdaU (DUF1376 family)
VNYIELHLGDYAKDTRHLTLLEHGVYMMLLQIYYGDEGPIDDARKYRLVSARTEDEREAVDTILSEFFTLSDGKWVNARAERELATYRERSESARDRANKRWKGNASAMQAQCSDTATPQCGDNETPQCNSNAIAMPQQCSSNAKAMHTNHQSPITNHQTPETTTPATATREVEEIPPDLTPIEMRFYRLFGELPATAWNGDNLLPSDVPAACRKLGSKCAGMSVEQLDSMLDHFRAEYDHELTSGRVRPSKATQHPWMKTLLAWVENQQAGKRNRTARKASGDRVDEALGLVS